MFWKLSWVHIKIMSTLQIFVASWLSAFVSGTDFYKRHQSLTTVTGITIPIGTTTAWFNDNLLTHVPGNFFVNLPNLDTIYFHRNVIFSVADYAFIQVPSVTYISLRENKLTIIREHQFAGLPNLQVSQDYFQNYDLLEYLSLDLLSCFFSDN